MKIFSNPELSVDLVEDNSVCARFDRLVTTIKTDNGHIAVNRQQWIAIVEHSMSFDRMLEVANLPKLEDLVITKEEIPQIGHPYGGGFYAGTVTIGDAFFALVVSPKATGHTSAKWKTSYTATVGTGSLDDGFTNTTAMGLADHPAAKFCRELRIGDHDDWYLPSKNELDLIYRNLAQRNAPVDAFKTDGAEAFPKGWHWSSTEFYPDTAWGQGFGDGYQGNDGKGSGRFVRAVRKVRI